MRGFVHAVRAERNMKIHLALGSMVIAGGCFFQISKVEWMLVIMVIAMVIMAEIINTALEELVDIVSPQFSDKAASAKNLGAAAVLVAACASVVVGILIFGPKIIEELK